MNTQTGINTNNTQPIGSVNNATNQVLSINSQNTVNSTQNPHHYLDLITSSLILKQLENFNHHNGITIKNVGIIIGLFSIYEIKNGFSYCVQNTFSLIKNNYDVVFKIPNFIMNLFKKDNEVCKKIEYNYEHLFKMNIKYETIKINLNFLQVLINYIEKNNCSKVINKNKERTIVNLDEHIIKEHWSNIKINYMDIKIDIQNDLYVLFDKKKNNIELKNYENINNNNNDNNIDYDKIVYFHQLIINPNDANLIKDTILKYKEHSNYSSLIYSLEYPINKYSAFNNFDGIKEELLKKSKFIEDEFKFTKNLPTFIYHNLEEKCPNLDLMTSLNEILLYFYILQVNMESCIKNNSKYIDSKNHKIIDLKAIGLNFFKKYESNIIEIKKSSNYVLIDSLCFPLEMYVMKNCFPSKYIFGKNCVYATNSLIDLKYWKFALDKTPDINTENNNIDLLKGTIKETNETNNKNNEDKITLKIYSEKSFDIIDEQYNMFINEISNLNTLSTDNSDKSKIKIYNLKICIEKNVEKVINPEYEVYKQKKNDVIEITTSLKDNKDNKDNITNVSNIMSITDFMNQPVPPQYITNESIKHLIKTDLVNEVYKNLDTLYLREKDLKKLKNCLSNFKNNKELMESLGIPNKLGVLLYGLPGTGKTSTIYAIATYFKKNIYYINLSTINTNEQLHDVFEHVNKNCNNSIIIFEDIDAMTNIVKKRVEVDKNWNIIENVNNIIDEKTCKLTLEYFLNLLQGSLTYEGSIFIATTNHLEHLDGAFYRDGRFDVKIEFRKCDHYQFQCIYKKFFNREIKKELLQKIKEDEFTPAQFIFHIKDYLLEDMTDEEILDRFLN